MRERNYNNEPWHLNQETKKEGLKSGESMHCWDKGAAVTVNELKNRRFSEFSGK